MFLGPVFRRISDFVTSLESRAAASTATADAHASVARALTKELPIAADPSGALARLSLLRPSDVTLPEDGSTALGYVRARPVQGNFDVLAAPSWAHGMAVAKTAGPFVDEHLIPSWIDTIVPVPKQIAIVRGLGGPAIAYLQPSSVSETRVQTGTEVTLGPGSIWIPAPLFAKDAPASGFAGIAFSAATLFVPDGIAPSPSGDVYLIGQGVTMQLDLMPVVAPAPPAGAANDSAGALASLPPNVHLGFAPDGVHVTGMDNAAMTAYGTNALFADGAATVAYDPDLAEIAISYRTVTSPAAVTVAASTSPTFTLRGTAPVVRGAYRIPVAITTASALGPAASGGALSLLLGAGMTGRWGGLDVPIAFTDTLLHVQTGVLGVLGRTAGRPFRDTYELWDARSTPDHPRASTITVSGPRGTLIREGESVAGEIVIVSGCRVEANIDRPLLASGSAPSLARLTAAYTLIHTGADTILLIEAGPTPAPPSIVAPPPPKPVSYVIENAVLRTAGVDALVAYGKLTGQRAMQGVLFLGNALDRLIPILPDPYASNVDIHEEIVSEQLIAVTSWTSPAAPHLAFAILRPPQQNAGAAAEFAPDVNVMLSRETFAATRGGLDALYDVSSAQNQFGVALSRVALAQGQILGQQLAVSGLQSGLFTVPAIAWEPVLDLGRGWFFPISADDGPPGIVAVPTVTLRPLEPAAFYDAFIADYGKGADLLASLTLPFGLTATVDTRADFNTQPVIARPDLLAIEPTFGPDRKGGKQLSLQGKYDPKYDRTVLPGSSRADSPYVQEILDKPSIAHVIANMWDEDFGGAPVAGAVTTHFVPLSRYDLSGYGASTFSDFQYHGDETGITEARFDVIVGRTAYELVQAQSFILPWNIQVVNTTIFERDTTGYVTRHNTGWRAKSDGIFAYKGVPATEIERGGVTGVFNVRNIVEGNPETVDGKTYVRVTFDADVQIVADAAHHGLKVTGGDPSGTGRLPSRGLTGYLIADAKDVPSIAESVKVLDALGSVSGPIAAEVDVNGTGIAMGLTGVEVTATRPDVTRNPTNPRTIAAAIRGTPHLPRDGSWSIAMRPRATTTPQSLDPKIPVPLMRSVADSATWRIADAADVVKFDDPLRFYGILQATGANKVFFEHPTIRNVAGKNPLNFDQTPKLADVGKLLGDNGLLPDILSLLDFGAFDGLAKSADGFSLKQTLKNNVDLGNRTLIPLGPVRVVMASWSDPPGQPKPTEITLDLDPTGSPRWRIAIKNIAFKLAVDGWGGDADALITVHGDASAQDGSAPTFSNIAVKYGSSLDIVKSILTEVEQFIAFLPGGKASGLDVSFAGSKLRVRENFPIPKLPLGLGYLEDISLSLGFDVDVLSKKLGFFVGLGDDQKPFHWLVSPLSGNGFLQLGATDQMGVKMQAGVGLGLAIDFAIVSGSASIVIAVQFDATSSPIGVMVLLTGQASVDVLDGLASASLTLTAGVGVKVSPGDPLLLLEVPPDPIEFLKQTTVTLMAEVAVGIHISVCWLVHIDFDGSWPFSETISGKTLAALV